MLPTQALFVTFAVYRSRSPQRVGSLAGFTMTELIITVAVMAIIATMAAPSFTNMIRRNQLSTATNEVLATLHFARAEAIRTNRRAIICAGNFSNPAQPACGGGDWRRMAVFSMVSETQLSLLREVNLTSPLTITALTDVQNTGETITFTPDGFVVGQNGGRTATLSVCREGLSAETGTFHVQANFGRITSMRVAGSC